MIKLSSLFFNAYLMNVRQSTRKLSFNSLSKWYREMFYPLPESPPYDHVCQIGDPVLRKLCADVDIESIKHPRIQTLISTMWKVLDRYECVGLAAPQVGVPLRIVVIKCEISNGKAVKPRVIINPKMKIVDYNSQIQTPEICASVRSFRAEVVRYTHVEIESFNEKAEKEKWTALGFEACVVQHEIDHLNGILLIDKMVPKTFECTAWQEVNYYGGKIAIPYGPRKMSIFDKIRI